MAYAVRRPVENLYLVRERDRQRTRELVVLALAAVPPAVVLFLAIWANLETVRLGYQLAGVSKNREALLERKQRLEMDRAQAAALARVEPIARVAREYLAAQNLDATVRFAANDDWFLPVLGRTGPTGLLDQDEPLGTLP